MEKMQSILSKKVLDLVRARYWTPKTRISDKRKIQNLCCPECGHNEAWMYADNPWSIICNRGDKCNKKSSVKELFPDLFESIEKNFPSVPGDQNRPARAYLELRGLRQALVGLDFVYWRDIRKTGSGGVMFPVGNDSNGKQILNGRLFTPPKGEGKTHNAGSTSGVFWFHPGRKMNLSEPVYVTEGILDALSLIEMGVQAIAVLSSGQDPSKLRLGDFKNLVAAFDSDKAGISALRRWKAYFKDKCSISGILPDKGKDWNDILMEVRGQNVNDYFEKKLPEYSFNADLALCSTAQEYLDRFLGFKKFSPQLFEFGGAYYYGKPQKSGEHFSAIQVSDFTVETDYYLLDETVKDRRVYRYGLSIYPQGRKRIKAIFEAKELSSMKDLVTSMLTHARCAWTGDRAATNQFGRMIVKSGARELRQLQSLGYDEITKSYIYPEFMIDTSGKMILPDSGLYSFPGNHHVRPAQFNSILPVPGLKARDLWLLLHAAWGNLAAVSLAWVVSSWFIHHVRSKTGFFPFLSLYHDPQTGKSALMRCLNRIQGIDEEGLAMTEGNSKKGPLRKLSQRSSLFIGLSEWNKSEKLKGFMENILSLYDGSALATRAAFTNGNEVIEIPFKGTLMFCQNVEPFQTTPQKERVISLRFEKERLSQETRKAFIELVGIPPGELAHFFVQVMRAREMIEASWHDEFITAKDELYLAGDTSNRLVDTHGLVLAFHRVLCRVIGVDYDLKDYVVEIMKQKHITSQNNDATTADTFFAEVASVLRACKANNKRGFLEFMDFDLTASRLWVHVHDFVNKTQSVVLAKHPIEKIKNALKDHPAFIMGNTTHRFKEYRGDVNGFVSCPKKGWCFDLNKIGDEFDFDIRSLNWN